MKDLKNYSNYIAEETLAEELSFEKTIGKPLKEVGIDIGSGQMKVAISKFNFHATS